MERRPRPQLRDDAHIEAQGVEPQAVEPFSECLLVERTQYRIFAEYARDHGHSKIDRSTVERDGEAAVLRHPALCDIKFGHHLDA